MFDPDRWKELENKYWRSGFFFGCAMTLWLLMLAGKLAGRGWFWLFR